MVDHQCLPRAGHRCTRRQSTVTLGSASSSHRDTRINKRYGRSRRRIAHRRQEVTLASTLLVAYCLCSGGRTLHESHTHSVSLAEAFSNNANSASLPSSRLLDSTSRLFVSIENNDRLSGMSSDEEDDDDFDDMIDDMIDDDDELGLSSYYRMQNRKNNNYYSVDAWSLEMQAAQKALEQLNMDSSFATATMDHQEMVDTATTKVTRKPFYAEKKRASTLAANLPFLKRNKEKLANGKAEINGDSNEVREVNGDAISIPQPVEMSNLTDTSEAPVSKRKRLASTVRKVWGSVVPIQKFGRVFERTFSDTGNVDADLEAERKRLNQEKKKRSKEEAIVARMSRKKKKQLSNLLQTVNRRNTKQMAGMTARTLTGLISAVADESEGLSVRMSAREDTPIWRKQIDTLSIEFNRLGFKPLSMGGPDQQLAPSKTEPSSKPMALSTRNEKDAMAINEKVVTPSMPIQRSAKVQTDDDDLCPVELLEDTMIGGTCADTAFQAIDVDNSGALDKDEIADALVLATTSASKKASSISEGLAGTVTDKEDMKVIKQLAKQLVDLYDANDDGVIDRTEYQSMVDDMAALRKVQKEQEEKEEEERLRQDPSNSDDSGWFSSAVTNVMRVGNVFNFTGGNNQSELDDEALAQQLKEKEIVDISESTMADDILATVSVLQDTDTPENMGKIELEDMKIDLRQLVLGAMPGVKHLRPGGPLFLEPFKVTVTGSFSAEDIMKSTLLDAGLRQLVSFALRVRVRGVRDLMDGAVWYGRKWKRGSAKAPLVECTEIISIDIDDKDRAIITGRAKVRATTDAPVIDQSFKLRTKVATPRNGRAIKLSEPEIAIVLECPPKVEQSINAAFAKLNMKPPPKPEPIYRYIPIHSPFNKNDDIGGYYMGEDNRIKSLAIKDKCLRIEMEAILRPGKFLGNHYLAFTVPQRAIIITVERVKNGIKAARQRKKMLKALKEARTAETDRKAHHAEDALALDNLEEVAPLSEDEDENLDKENEDKPKVAGKGFISRFVDGYLQAGSEGQVQNKEKLAHAISDWFGRQSTSSDSGTSNSASDIETPRPGDAVTNIIEDITLDQIRDD